MNSKQFFFALNTDDTDEFLDTNKGFYREMWNMVPGNEVTSNPSRQKVKGNTRLTIDFNETEGNICIGACSDNGRNRLVFFIHKPGGVDAIYMWQSGTTGATKIFEWEGLDFSPAYPIEHAFIVDDLLYWVEPSNAQRCLNIKRALEGDYVDKEIDIDLAKKGPAIPPTSVFTTSRDAQLATNKVCFNNYQFAYRFKYKDGTHSVPSPHSKTQPAYQFPNLAFNARSINVTVQIPPNLRDYVSEVDFLVDENKLGAWKIFFTEKNIGTSSTMTRNFDAQTALISLSDDEIKLFEPIPKRSSAQVFIKNRNIINSFINGHNDDDFNYNLYLDGLINNLDDEETYNSVRSSENLQYHLKSGGSYTVALCFYDEYHRITSVKKKISITPPERPEQGAPKRHLARIGLTGTPPSYAHYFSIPITQESIFDLYMQIPVMPLFYVSEYNPEDGMPSNTFAYNGAVYLEEAPSSFAASFASRIHLLMPLNIPFVPDSSFIVRLKMTTPFPVLELRESPIIEVRGNMLVVDTFGIDNWQIFNVFQEVKLSVEIYRPKQIIDEEFYEQGRIYPISEFTGTKYIGGDTNYHFFGSWYVFDNIEGKSIGFPTSSAPYITNLKYTTSDLNAEAPTSTTSSANISTAVEAEVEKKKEYYNGLDEWIQENLTINLGPIKFNFLKGAMYQFFEKPPPWVFKGYKFFSKPPSQALDYSRPTNNHGRTIIILDNERELSMPNLMIASNVYMANTQINGLHNYEATNIYVLPYDRGSVVKWVAANDVVVSVHEHNISTMYPGEAYMRQGDELSWVITDEFMRQDNKLAGGLGSQDPGSIVEHDGKVYGLDRLRAEPWRRSTDGVTPLATTYGTKKWFVDKCAKYLGQDVKIIGGYDPYLHIYYITFPALDTEPAITVGFCEKYNIWVGFYNFIPERYGYVGNSMVTFKNGVPWLHHSNETRGSFYGTTYPARIKVLVNNEYSNDKIFKALGIESNSKWEITSITTPAGQESYIPASKFIKRGDHYVADVLRDQNTPDAIVPAGKPKLLFGREMAGPSIEVTLENSETGEVRIRHLNTRYVKVSGNIMV